MLTVLRNETYRRLFGAQVVALIGTGLLTVALALLAYDIAGAQAGAVLGTALAIKMIAYVGLAPIAQAFAGRLPRRGFLIAMDLMRAAVALALPFVGEVWQVYVLIFVLQSASAAFTPAFQATIPDILPDERDYARALSLSRLAHDLESLLSPALAAALLTVVAFHTLFVGTTLGFLASAALVVMTRLPQPEPGPARGICERTTRGLRIYLATPRLRGLLALSLSVAAAGAMVIVNTVAIVQGTLGLAQPQVAVAMACFGGGSMAAALLLPRVLDEAPDRPVMLGAAVLLGVALLAVAALLSGREGPAIWPSLLAAWFVLGLGYCGVLMPTGRLLRRSASASDRPALFAAQFALSHACWLVTYPLAGWLGASVGLAATSVILAALTFCGVVAAMLLWPGRDPEVLVHDHRDLPADHPHLQGSGRSHGHAFVIDDLHRRWPGAR